jgi:hypothetical protein
MSSLQRELKTTFRKSNEIDRDREDFPEASRYLSIDACAHCCMCTHIHGFEFLQLVMVLNSICKQLNANSDNRYICMYDHETHSQSISM